MFIIDAPDRVLIFQCVVVSIVVACTCFSCETVGDTVVEAITDRCGQSAAIVAANADIHIRMELLRPLGDDIDHAAHRLIAEQGAGAAFNDFNAFDVFQRYRGHIGRGNIGRIVQPSAVDQDQGVGSRGGTKSAHVEHRPAAAIAIQIADLNSGPSAQQFGHVSGTTAFYILRRDDGDARRCRYADLLRTGGAHHHRIQYGWYFSAGLIGGYPQNRE